MKKMHSEVESLLRVLHNSLCDDKTIAEEISRAIAELSNRELVYSARWCTELLYCVQPKTSGQPRNVQYPIEPKVDVVETEETAFILAKSYFSCREYRRCADILRNNNNEKCLFLRCYALFLAGEKGRLDGSLQAESLRNLRNRELEQILLEICNFEESNKKGMDAFLCYLCGILSRDLQRKKEAIYYFAQAVRQFPLLFDAWKELSRLVSLEENQESFSSSHWMSAFYHVLLWSEQQRHEDALSLLTALQQYFPQNTFIEAQIAYLHYDRRDFNEAAYCYEIIRKRDAYWMDGVDIYSNILYVQEQKVELSILAHHCAKVDKYRPETCAVIGNYYSLRGEHEKAIIYFERALKLNPYYVSAWTLIGHEYVEMKNTSKAIEAYRKAVDIQPRDFRAWYGLGQAYELLRMPSYSLYYYRQAASLRPFDSRMWCAMGLCFEEIGQLQDALILYQRALKCEDREGTVLKRLAHLHHQMGNLEEAYVYYLKDLQRRDEEDTEGAESAEALLFISRYLISKGQLDEAESYCSRLLDFSGTERDEAKDLLKAIDRKREILSSQMSSM